MKSNVIVHHRIGTRTDQTNFFHVSKSIRENRKFAIILQFALFFSLADDHRVPLKGEHPDYINAVYINVIITCVIVAYSILLFIVGL